MRQKANKEESLRKKLSISLERTFSHSNYGNKWVFGETSLEMSRLEMGMGAW